jgi:DNA-binding NarL/FixJ family response regulator
MEGEKKKTWLLADDHSIVRQGVELLLSDLFPDDTVIHTNNLQQIQQLLEDNVIDIAVFDAEFPDGNIVQILPDIRKKFPTLKILIFSSFDESQYALKFIHAGANGFLSKLSDEETLELALQKMHKEGSYINATVQMLLLNSIQNPGQSNPLSLLTDREKEIAELYAQGLGNLEIANHLNLKQNTVSTMKKRVLEKLELKTTLELIDFLRREIMI